MDTKKIVYGIILLIILLFALAFVFNGFSFSNHCNVGNAFFDLPNGYQMHFTSIHHNDDCVSVNITNGKNTVSIVEYKYENLDNVLQKYYFGKSKENHPLEISNLTINNIPVIKSVDTEDNKIVHYWFSNNGKVYNIYSWDGNKDFDKDAEFMINSMSSSIF